MCFTCPLKGFFVGVGTAAPGSISGVICNVVILVSSIFMSKLGGEYGSKVASLLNNPEFVNAYKAFMVPLAVMFGYMVEFLFLFVTYMTGGRNTRIADRDMSRYHEPTLELCSAIIKGMFPYNITGFVQRGFLLTTFIMIGIFIPKAGEGVLSPAIYIGAIYGKYVCIVAFIGLFIEFMTLCFKNYCIGGIRRNELKFTREKMAEGVHMIMALSMFFGFAFMTIGSSLLIGTFGDYNLVGTDLFAVGFLAIVFIPFGLYFKTFVSFTNKKRASLILALVAFILSGSFLFIISKLNFQ